MPLDANTERQTGFDSLREVLSYVETLHAHELGFIGSRMNWFAIAESFLFGAYATIATDPARLRAVEHAAAGTATTHPAVAATTSFLLLALPIVGLTFAVVAWVSVRAAGRVLTELDRFRGDLLLLCNEQFKAQGRPPIPVVGNAGQRKTYQFNGARPLAGTNWQGRLPQWVLPLLMAAVWAWLLLSRFNLIGNLRLP
jgi:hypothetical protein